MTDVLSITCVKNEGTAILDWICHHRALGITGFLVYSNDCRDGTDAILDRLAARGWLTHERNPGPWRAGPQWAALTHAATHPRFLEAHWVLVHDVDEYLNIHAGDGSLAALISAVPQANAIALTWRLFGNCGRVFADRRPPTESFTRAAPRIMGWPWRAAMIKTLWDRSRAPYARPGVHRPRAPQRERLGEARWVDGTGRPLGPEFHTGRIYSDYSRDNFALAQINHYALGAMDSFVLKCDRGRANREKDMFDPGYWIERNFCAEEDVSIARHAAATAALRAELADDPEIGRLVEAAWAWRQARFAALMREERWRGLFGRLMLAGPSRPLPPGAEALMRKFAQDRTD